jgi:hypothetical protein
MKAEDMAVIAGWLLKHRVSGALQVPEIPSAQELRAGCQSWSLCAMPQATCDFDQ